MHLADIKYDFNGYDSRESSCIQEVAVEVEVQLKALQQQQLYLYVITYGQRASGTLFGSSSLEKPLFILYIPPDQAQQILLCHIIFRYSNLHL